MPFHAFDYGAPLSSGGPGFKLVTRDGCDGLPRLGYDETSPRPSSGNIQATETMIRSCRKSLLASCLNAISGVEAPFHARLALWDDGGETVRSALVRRVFFYRGVGHIRSMARARPRANRPVIQSRVSLETTEPSWAENSTCDRC